MIQFLVLCFLMTVGSFIAGEIPLHFSFSGKGSSLNGLGSGLLIGTVLAIIIPEGTEKLLESLLKETSHDTNDYNIIGKSMGWSLLLGYAFLFVLDHFNLDSHHENTPLYHLHSNRKKSFAVLGLVIHSISDGIALGASFVSDQPLLERIMVSFSRQCIVFSYFNT